MDHTETVVSADTPLDLSLSEAELDAHREHITEFIRSTVDDAGADRAVIGLSGGIDSTLTAHLLVEAVGPDPVHALVMPSAVSRDANMSDAERVANDLGVEYEVIALEPLAEAFLDAYPDAAGDRVAIGNLHVRTRAVLNYLVANHEQGLVLGTGNRSEAAVGYFTKYGDGAVDCHPLANLYKGQVRQLASHVGVPDDLVAKTATAGMWIDQTDEGELGMDYPTLDSVLALHVDGPLSMSATARHLGVDESVVAEVRALNEASEHKRRVPPGPEPLY